MSSFFQYFSVLAFFIVLMKPCTAETPDTPDTERARSPLKLTIRVYNYARVPQPTLERTGKETARIFNEVGIETVLQGCPTSEAEIQKFQGCAPHLGPTDVVLKIIPRFDSKREGFQDALFGFAAGFQVTVVYSRVEELVREEEASRPLVLAVAIAHEVGHVLLGQNSHSPIGIMRPQWKPEDFRGHTRDAFCFTLEQAKRLQAELLVRVQKQTDSSSPPLTSTAAEENGNRQMYRQPLTKTLDFQPRKTREREAQEKC